ncbi:exopolysaccharide biosynthesis protein [Microbulbifer halophilus]|uniref:Exopolysaccharide biosynthesis protein n=2 Tax=Microbulbifer halophilus TaxID=453963 RepID=A0ABW5EAB4_9GAMM|nr:exopolysaccharide biosynthesis protein [Microbulbifer halophilus]MCW8127906.1 exopolysaccharide biosynthesis protein [Microbulbifer halophilus]
MSPEFTSLSQLLEHIAKTAKRRQRVSLDLVVREVGQRSFAPLLLLVGIILFSPLSGIPGVPTLMAILVLLVAVQLLLGRQHFWLPQWMLKRSVPERKLLKALDWLYGPARFIDRWLRPRLTFLVRRTGTYVIAAICAVIALALPAMEIIPFSATTAGLALTAFGLALVTHDGLLAVLAFVFTGLLVMMVLLGLLGLL